jgi:hypothetical protein
MDLFLLYCWTRLDYVSGMLATTAFIGTFIVIISGFIIAMSVDEGRISAESAPKLWRVWRRVAWGIGTCIVLWTLVPDSKDLAYIVAGRFAIQTVQSPEAKKLLDLATQAIERSLAPEKK